MTVTTDKREVRNMAFYTAGKTYTGKPCRKCGNKVRYMNSRRCVECKNALSKAEWQRNKSSLVVKSIEAGHNNHIAAEIHKIDVQLSEGTGDREQLLQRMSELVTLMENLTVD